MAKKRSFAGGGDAYAEMARIKAISEEGKREAMEESGLTKSKDPRDIELVKGIKKDQANDTDTMYITRPGYGKRIDSKTGRPTGPEMRKTGSGEYEGMKKGGVVKHRGDGIVQRGKTKGRFV